MSLVLEEKENTIVKDLPKPLLKMSLADFPKSAYAGGTAILTEERDTHVKLLCNNKTLKQMHTAFPSRLEVLVITCKFGGLTRNNNKKKDNSQNWCCKG